MTIEFAINKIADMQKQINDLETNADALTKELHHCQNIIEELLRDLVQAQQKVIKLSTEIRRRK